MHIDSEGGYLTAARLSDVRPLQPRTRRRDARRSPPPLPPITAYGWSCRTPWT